MAHVSGSLVLMADYSWKNNSEIREGDKILGADLKSATVVETIIVSLGNKRVFSLLEKPYVRFNETDSLWAIDKNREWWWVESAGPLTLEWQKNKIGLKILDSIMVHYDVQYATLNGFEKQTVIDVSEEYSVHTTMPFFMTDRACPIIINGQVVASGINEYIYDYTEFKWIDNYRKLKELMKEII